MSDPTLATFGPLVALALSHGEPARLRYARSGRVAMTGPAWQLTLPLQTVQALAEAGWIEHAGSLRRVRLGRAALIWLHQQLERAA